MLTQGYTPEIVATVHDSIRKDIAKLNGAAKHSVADDSVNAVSPLSYQGRLALHVGIEEMEESVALGLLQT